MRSTTGNIRCGGERGPVFEPERFYHEKVIIRIMVVMIDRISKF